MDAHFLCRNYIRMNEEWEQTILNTVRRKTCAFTDSLEELFSSCKTYQGLWPTARQRIDYCEQKRGVAPIPESSLECIYINNFLNYIVSYFTTNILYKNWCHTPKVCVINNFSCFQEEKILEEDRREAQRVETSKSEEAQVKLLQNLTFFIKNTINK